MSDDIRLISEGGRAGSTPERRPPTARPRPRPRGVKDLAEKPTTKAWGVEEVEELSSYPRSADEASWRRPKSAETSLLGRSPPPADSSSASPSHSPLPAPVTRSPPPQGSRSPASSSGHSSTPPPAVLSGKASRTSSPQPVQHLIPEIVTEVRGEAEELLRRGSKRQVPKEEEEEAVSEGLQPSSRLQQASGGEVASEVSSLRSGTPGSSDLQGSKSYRERIRQRVQAAKERAIASGAFKQRPVKPRSPSRSGSRSDEFDRDEERVEEALKKHREVKSKWKVASSSVQVATIQAGYEFFSKGWEAPVKAPPDEEETENTQKDEGGSSEDEKLTSGQLLGSDWLPLYTHQPPQPTDPRQLKERQIGLYFCPSTSPVPLEEKLEAETPPRFIEEEGLFVGKKTKVPYKTRNKLEQRIMAMGSEKFWFGEDGEIKGLPDPLEYKSFNIFVGDEESSEFKVEFVPAQKVESRSLSASGTETYLLEVEVGGISFRHHPLFSREHILGERLRCLCQGTDNRTSVKLEGRLQALRTSRDHLLKLYTVSKDELHLNRANRLRDEIREVRAEWLKEKSRERQRLGETLETWRDLKQLRERQGYTSSVYRLRILRREEDQARQWRAHYQAYLEEMYEAAEEDYRSALEEYNERLEKWKRKQERRQEEGLSSGEDLLSGSEDEALVEPGQPPEKPKRSELEVRVREELSQSLPPQGEPALGLELLEDAEVSPSTGNPMEEERRKQAALCKLCVQLEVNGREVDRAFGTPLAHDFTSQISHRFSLRLQSQPSTLSLKLMDSGQPSLFGKKPIAQIYIPVPGKVHIDSAEWCDYEFSCGRRSGPFKHTGVGSGQVEQPQQQLMSGETRTLYTGGHISLCSGWEDPLPTVFPQSKLSKAAKRTKTNAEKLKEWVKQVQLDPNDPENADLFDYLKSEDNKTPLKDVDSGRSPLEFCSEDEIFNNPRLKLLMLRQSGQPEFRAIRHVPLTEREIPKDIFKMYEKRISGRKRKLKGGTIDQERLWAKEFIEQIKEDVLKKNRLNQAKTFTDMVHEEPVPDLGTLGLTFMKWLQPKRPLRPRRKQRKKFPVKSLVGHQLEIIINIGRAFEVPVRKEGGEEKLVSHPGGGAVGEPGFSLVPVRPFIEVAFQGQRRRTNTAEGPNPTWNQDLHLPIDTPHGDLNPVALQSLKESIHIHLYDEKLVDIIEDERQRETSVHQRLERHWLASLRIPFAALYYNSRIEGTFQMYSPPVLLGYERESKEFRDSTFLTVFLIVHPPLNPTSPLHEKLESSEELYVEQHLELWLAEVRKAHPGRHVPALVMDSTGKSVCVTRFFKPIPPPELDPDMKTTPEMAARFVSMIPVLPGNLLYPGYIDIWLTADQLLGLGVSESCSVGVLLCCYLSGLGLQTWLLVGCGRSSGPALFVLSKSLTGELKVWDPTTGKSYATSHPFSPLSRVYCLIDDSNIWVNNQKEDRMPSCSLDVKKRSDWWPAFGRSVSAPVGCLQPASLLYKPTQDVRPLEARLEKVLRNAIMKLRPTHRTIWNRYCTASLKKLLPGLERSAWTGEATSTIDHIQELQHILASYKMCGFPINLPYTSSAELVDAVKSTGVHLNDAPEIEFSVAVHIHPFPNNVLSVWLYVASLIRRR